MLDKLKALKKHWGQVFILHLSLAFISKKAILAFLFYGGGTTSIRMGTERILLGPGLHYSLYPLKK